MLDGRNGSEDRLQLPYGLEFGDLYRLEGLSRLDEAFVGDLREHFPELAGRLVAARQDPASLPPKAESELIIAVSPHLEDFIAQLFGIEAELGALQSRHSVLARCRRSSVSSWCARRT